MSDSDWRKFVRERRPKLRRVSQETWQMVRRGCELGQAARSLAEQFEVRLVTHCRRQAKNWHHPPPQDRLPELLVGGTAYACQLRHEFRAQMSNEREMAEPLMAYLSSETDLHGPPLQHLGFLLHCRALPLKPETAASVLTLPADRDSVRDAWEADGRCA